MKSFLPKELRRSEGPREFAARRADLQANCKTLQHWPLCKFPPYIESITCNAMSLVTRMLIYRRHDSRGGKKSTKESVNGRGTACAVNYLLYLESWR